MPQQSNTCQPAPNAVLPNPPDTNSDVCSCTVLMCRLCVVAMEQEHDSGLPRPAGVTRGCLTFRDSSLFDFLIPRLTRIVPHLVNLARPVSYWLRGRFELASRLGLVPGSESSKEQAEEFAAVFVPSPHMVSSRAVLQLHAVWCHFSLSLASRAPCHAYSVT
jgi:hypothetical protein